MPDVDLERELTTLAQALARRGGKRLKGAARIAAVDRSRELIGVRPVRGVRQPLDSGARQTVLES